MKLQFVFSVAIPMFVKYQTWDNKLKQASHFSGDTKFQVFSTLFPGKSNEITDQIDVESVFVLII